VTIYPDKFGDDLTFHPILEFEGDRTPTLYLPCQIRLGEIGVGLVEPIYNFKKKEVSLDSVRLRESWQGQGLGKAVYRRISDVGPPVEGGYTLVSGQLNQYSTRVWESLVRTGEAEKTGYWSYRMSARQKEK
jgi:GNAT superfamily N-acetyltransferase